MKRDKISIALLTLVFFAWVPAAFAHATLVRSSPADQSIVHAHSLTLVLDYNSRIDASRCTLTVTGANGQRIPLRMQHTSNPAELKAFAGGLPNGRYTMHWQVLASDGHITRGDVAFTVAVK
ncbi:MAG: copper resistance CopC family protein [Acidobacteriaceae bacterium]